VQAVVEPFVNGLGVWWNAATLALARSGAGNVAEVWANGVPAVFMPYPYHKDQHQRVNAKTLVAAGGAIVHTDHIDPAKNSADVGGKLSELLRERGQVQAMRDALKKLGPADGAERVAGMAIEMAAR
jgi:UDP-N-acetylglucosamine--N-acetylmuramyl-(pentapeptide) pyrophosphoryl-undecaprenol N-acetylglucosamine transferase